ncbi:hypothetical protein FHG87_001305, partial [Trinorchestia longiramus]
MDEMMATEETHHHHHVKDLSNIQGHLVPGIIFTIYGMLWLRNALLRFHIARREAKLKGRNLTKLNYKNIFFSKYHSLCCAQLPVEAISAVVIGISGGIVEVIASFQDGKFHFVLAHHAVMYAIYVLLGVSGILIHYKAAVPPNIDYAAFILSNSVQALLFLGHVINRTLMNIQ